LYCTSSAVRSWSKLVPNGVVITCTQRPHIYTCLVGDVGAHSALAQGHCLKLIPRARLHLELLQVVAFATKLHRQAAQPNQAESFRKHHSTVTFTNEAS
jgi:hypothetical protein